MKKKVGLVCIIDDDKIYRFTTKKYIQMMNLADSIITYSDGEEAIEGMKNSLESGRELPDIILLDVNMPIMDGWDFLEEFEKIKIDPPKKVKIYMVSSSIDDRDSDRAKTFEDVTDYVIKPINEEHLVALIK